VKRATEQDGMLEHQDPVLAVLAQAPDDDEPVSAEDERAIAEGWAAYRRGEVEAAADAKRQTMTQPQDKQGAPV
jgi:hypothetical protein